MPQFSIVINNYNYGRYLPEALASALAQDVDREVIVVDDGSTDGSEEVLRDAEAKGCMVVRKPNGGQASAFNAGFARARGRWIYFLDADDMLLPGALRRVEAVFRPGLAKVHFPLSVFRDGEGPTGELLEGIGLSRGDVMRQIADTGRHSWPPTSGNVFARDCLAAILPMNEQEYRISADSYLNTSAPFFGEIAAIDEPLACYRVHGNNLFYGGHRSAEAVIKDSRLVVRAAETMHALLVEGGVVHDPGVFHGREFTAARILFSRFGADPAAAAGRREILMRFRKSPQYRAASLVQKARWWPVLAVFCLAPHVLVRATIDARSRLWRLRGALGLR